jgi:hypothetical protein
MLEHYVNVANLDELRFFFFFSQISSFTELFRLFDLRAILRRRLTVSGTIVKLTPLEVKFIFQSIAFNSF